MKKPGFVRFVAFAAAFALMTAIQPSSPAIAATACSLTQLEPQLGELMVTQGVGGTTGNAYSLLTRGKETLAKVFLTLPTSCSVGTGYIKVTDAKLAMSNLDAATKTLLTNTLFTNLGGAPSIPATTAQPSSPADPIFVVPAANTVQGPIDASFTATFTATITYTRKSQGSSTIETLKTKEFTPTVASPQAKSFERQTNALRILVIPMGDASQPYSTQYTPADQQIVQNAMQTLARIYPVPDGTGDLAGGSGGVRYTVDTATMLNLPLVSGKFCGTSSNFATIKGLLAQYLLSHNTANTANPTPAIADRVVGVVDENISLGSTGCAQGMASVSSAESWVRLIADVQGGAPSMSGALASMEMSHTFGLELGQPTYHSGTVEADRSTSRAYNQANRALIANDHDVMDFNATTPWDNTSTLLAAGDFSYLLCKLKPSSTGSATTCPPGNVGTTAGVFAGPRYVIAGTTDGIGAASTHVVEPYYADYVGETASVTDSLLRLVQLDSTGVVVPGGNFGVPWSPCVTHVVAPCTAQQTFLQTFYAAAPGFSSRAGEVRLVKVTTPADNPLGGTILFSSLKIDPPVITDLTGGVAPTSGGNVTVFRSQITPRIPPKPDIVFLADTTGSMDLALQSVKDNANKIMNAVLGEQPDAQFAVASYKDNLPDGDQTLGCLPDPYVFRLEKALTAGTDAGKAAVSTAIGTWSAGGGCDIPEAQLNALYRVGVGDDGAGEFPNSIGYRDASSRVAVWFGDAPGHDRSVGHSESDATTALQSKGVRVIAVNMLNTGFNSSLDQTSQATRISGATTGVVEQNNDATKVADDILKGLQDLPAKVTPVVNTSNCDSALHVTFSPTERTVPSGTNAGFAEQVAVDQTTAGSYMCEVDFKINDRFVCAPAIEGCPLDSRFVQIITVNVADGQRQQVTVKATSADASRLKLDLLFQCNSGFSFLAAVAIPPDAATLTTTEATFFANADRTNACSKQGGGGTLVPFVSDGWNRAGGTVQSDTSSAVKLPTAAIYNPATNASIEWNATLPLRGSGEVAGIELPGSALSWSIRPPGGTFTTVGGGSALDVRATDVSPNGWTQGTWTARLTVTSAEFTTATADFTFVGVTLGVPYQFIGFLSPVQNSPAINTGTAGKTFVLKWQLMSAGTPVSSLATVTSTKYALSACGPAVTTAFANTSGGSVLKFDQLSMQFLFNWQTPSTVGMYVFRLTLSDGSQHDACVNLTK